MKRLKESLTKLETAKIDYDQLSRITGGDGGGHDLYTGNYDNGRPPPSKPKKRVKKGA